MNLAAQIIKRAAQKNKLSEKQMSRINNEVAAQNYEFSCPNLRQPIFSMDGFLSISHFLAQN
jgi:hypothetical protein